MSMVSFSSRHWALPKCFADSGPASLPAGSGVAGTMCPPCIPVDSAKLASSVPCMAESSMGVGGREGPLDVLAPPLEMAEPSVLCKSARRVSGVNATLRAGVLWAARRPALRGLRALVSRTCCMLRLLACRKRSSSDIGAEGFATAGVCCGLAAALRVAAGVPVFRLKSTSVSLS